MSKVMLPVNNSLVFIVYSCFLALQLTVVNPDRLTALLEYIRSRNICVLTVLLKYNNIWYAAIIVHVVFIILVLFIIICLYI